MAHVNLFKPFMFFKKQELSMAHTQTGDETIIAEGVKVEGDFRSNGDISISGELNGSLETTQSLNVGNSAVIHAQVSAKSAVIAGTVVGNIHVQESLDLLSTSNVNGDIQTNRISVAAGAIVNGKVTMGESSN